MSQVDIDVYKEWLGIPDGPRPPDHYQLLRLVQFEDQAEKIRNNYKKLNGHVRKYAAGKYSVRSQELLNELAKAMLCLTDVERKSDYDVSLGRVVEEKKGQRKPLEVLLVQKQVLTSSQMEQARQHAEKTGLDMRDVVVQLKLTDQSTATQAYAEELGLPYIELADLYPDDSILDLVPKQMVKQNSILPLFVDEDVLLVACVHPMDPDLEDQLRLRTNTPVRAVLATPLEINQGIAKYYAPGARNEAAGATTTPGSMKKGSKSAAQKSTSQLTPEEKGQRKLMGVLVMCWVIIGSALIDSFVLQEYALVLGMCITLVTAPVAAALVYINCFKK